MQTHVEEEGKSLGFLRGCLMNIRRAGVQKRMPALVFWSGFCLPFLEQCSFCELRLLSGPAGIVFGSAAVRTANFVN